jgi:hypothetical protein
VAIRRHRTAATIIVTFCLLTACGGSSSAIRLDRNGLPVGGISAGWVKKQPLSSLYYPGSRPFYMLDSGSSEDSGDGPAYAGAILTSSATGAQIYAWYISKLRSRGWSFLTDDGCLDIQPSCPQFDHAGHGSRETFYLAIDNPMQLPSVIGKRPPPACTVYEIAYEVFPPGGISVPGKLTFNGGNECWWTGKSWHQPADVP